MKLPAAKAIIMKEIESLRAQVTKVPLNAIDSIRLELARKLQEELEELEELEKLAKPIIGWTRQTV